MIPFYVRWSMEGWKDPATEELRTYTFITADPNESGTPDLHSNVRIPPKEHHEAWLAGEAGKDILVPFSAEQMKMSDQSKGE